MLSISKRSFFLYRYVCINTKAGRPTVAETAGAWPRTYPLALGFASGLMKISVLELRWTIKKTSRSKVERFLVDQLRTTALF